MGFLKNFFIEEVPSEASYPVDMPDIPDVSEEASVEPVSLDNFGQDTLIEDIYSKAGITNPNGIFKVEEVAGNLPKETPKAVKRATTISMLNSFGISIESVVGDGNDRFNVLDSALSGIIKDFEDFEKSSESEIESYKTKISEAERRVAAKKDDTKAAVDKITAEKDRVSDLLGFIGGDGK